MKSIFSILALCGLLLTLSTSCTDWLDNKPENDIVLEEFWQNESQATEVLAACYRSLIESSCMTRMMVWGELRSDNITTGLGMSSDNSRMMSGDLTPSNYLTQWGALYSVINYCNSFLYYGPGVVEKDPDFTLSKYKMLESEALTIRALAYFYLVRAFRDVPWIDKPSISDQQNYRVAKSDEAVILDNIVADLLVAEQNARKNFDSDAHNKGRVTTNAVRALLADIYLWRGQFRECVEMCDLIIADPSLMLVPHDQVISSVFSKGNSTESIFELQFDDQFQPNVMVWTYYGNIARELGEWAFNPNLIDTEDSPFEFKVNQYIESERDVRIKDFIQSVGGYNLIFKYAGSSRTETPTSSEYWYNTETSNWIVYRLSDIMLMKAEAHVQLDTQTDFDKAMEMVNTTYLRSNPELAGDSLRYENYGGKLEMEELVLRERQRELMFEGKRWFDLMRLARRANSTSPILTFIGSKLSGGSGNQQSSKLSTMDALYLPINATELETNSALIQNPFYETTGSSSTSN